MRLFIGLPLGDKTKNILKTILNNLYSQGLRGNFTTKNNLHETLAFLGECDEVMESKLIDLVNSYNESINVTLSKLTKLKDMVIYEVTITNELLDLFNDLRNKLLDLGFNIPESYYPHVTMVRKYSFSKDINSLTCPKVESINNKLVLFESKRINGELVYIKKN